MGSCGGFGAGQPATILRASGLSGTGLRATLQRDRPLAPPVVAATTRQPAPTRVAVTRPILSLHTEAFPRRTVRTAAIAWGFVNAGADARPPALAGTRQSAIRAVAASDPRHTCGSSHSSSGKSIREKRRRRQAAWRWLHHSPNAAQAFR